ncbi:MAG: glutathione S-transferase family protein [Pseudomonadota bacterium]
MITLYGGPTTNVRKVAIALEELGIDYTPRPVSLDRKEQFEDWFLGLAPNNKIPVIKDDETGIKVWESGAILTYLGEQYDPQGTILPSSGQARYDALQGAFFQAAHIGPNLGRLNDQLTATEADKIPQMIEVFYAEAVRLTTVVDRMLSDGRQFLAGDYSIADIMHYPWLKAGLDMKFPAMLDKPRLPEWLGRIGERPAVKRGMLAFGEDQGLNALPPPDS